MQELFEEILEEASLGEVIIDNEEWPITFNTKVYENGIEKKSYVKEDRFSTLIINDEEEFYNLLEKYIITEISHNRKTPLFCSDVKRNKLKWIMVSLFSNARTQDFIDPINFLRRSINFLNDTTLDYLEDGLEINTGIELLNSKLLINKKEASTSMETPNKIELVLQNKIDNELVEYPLPTVYYGISNTTCYIYSIINNKNKKEISNKETIYRKKINRTLYKLNNGINKSKDYTEYKEGISTDYPEENIIDVTHSFLLSLDIFLNILDINNIKEVKAIPYLPVRYAARFISASRVNKEEKRKELNNRNNKIQTNATNKFIRTFRRLSYHDKNIVIKSYPYEIDEFLTLVLNPQKYEVNNDILKLVTNSIKKGKTYHK